MNQFDRTKKLIGEDSVQKLRSSKVLVFGVGGVGGYTCEGLVRAGIGKIDIVDKDTIDITNINRQIIANHDTVGRPKVDVMKERMLLINPEVDCETYNLFFACDSDKNGDSIDFSKYDYIIDAVDTVTAKLEIIKRAKESNARVISSMGTGNKLNPTMFQIADIEKTKVCPLAKVMRKELKALGIRGVKVLYSEEEPIIATREPASISTVPSVAGLIIANEVIKDLISG